MVITTLNWMSVRDQRCMQSLPARVAGSVPSPLRCNLKAMDQILLLTVSGHDKPGLRRSLLAILEEYRARVLHSSPGVVDRSVALALVLEVRGGVHALQKAIFAKADHFGVTARVDEISAPALSSLTHSNSFVVTVMAPVLTAAHLGAIVGINATHRLHHDAIERLSSRESLSGSSGPACVQFRVSGENFDSAELRAAFLSI